MRHRYKRETKWMILAISLLVAGYLVLAESRAAAKPDNEHFHLLKKRLITDGFNPTKINRLYSRPQVFFEADGVTILFTYKEAKVDYGQFTNNWSIRKAKQYMQKHEGDLIRTEKAFGVDRKIITAIMLVETGLGASVGTRSTLNTLSTLTALMDPVVREQFWDLIPDSKKISRKKFEKKAADRSKWAYKELKAFLKYAHREGFDPASIPAPLPVRWVLPNLCPPAFWLTARTATTMEPLICSITPTPWPVSPIISKAMDGVRGKAAKKPKKLFFTITTAPIM